MIHDSDKDNETALQGLRIGAYGWKHEPWCDGFYPDDLPEDWQLTYYANEFSTVLLPADYCSQAELDVEQLLDDVPENFIFYLK